VSSGEIVDKEVEIELPPSNGLADPSSSKIATLVLGAIGVVYGDIGTSPLYALRESLMHMAIGGLSTFEIFGVVSLLIWTILLIVTVKYVLFLMCADNAGEGGTLSLLALVERGMNKKTTFVFMLGATGAALFYGDAILTPAISVLSAVEGLKTITPIFEPYVLPLTITLLIALFLFQHRGTGVVAVWFGPIMLVWLVVIAAMAIPVLYEDQRIFAAFNPKYACALLASNGYGSFSVLGSIFLAVTGAEALYADMGHFGIKPIRVAWLYIVFPALLLTYLGQGALVLNNPQAANNPFFLLVPEWALFPVVILATFATFIASQAVISGAYSLTRQAVNLGLFPRFQIKHTSDTQEGQIYVPSVNWLLLSGVLMLVLMFQTSSNLAWAYGIAVTGTMLVTSMLAYYFLRNVWKWPLIATITFISPFIVMEFVFLLANLTKLQGGGCIPLTLAIVILLIMRVWSSETAKVRAKCRRDSIAFSTFVSSVPQMKLSRAVGTAVFMTTDPEMTPPALLHNIKHNHVLHSQNIIMTVRTARVPKIKADDRVQVEQLTDSFIRLDILFGYMEAHNVPKAMAACRKLGLKFDIMSTSFFVGRRIFRLGPRQQGPIWNKKLFIALAGWAVNATDYHAIPAGRVVELGHQLTI